MRVVLDTCVLVAAMRSRRGASFQVLSRIGGDLFEIALSVPLVLEYEAAMLRHVPESPLDDHDVVAIIDYLCLVARRQPIYFLWRPLLKDPNDDMVAEVAVAAGCEAIVTHNVSDFVAVDQLGLRVLRPSEFLAEIGA